MKGSRCEFQNIWTVHYSPLSKVLLPTSQSFHPSRTVVNQHFNISNSFLFQPCIKFTMEQCEYPQHQLILHELLKINSYADIIDLMIRSIFTLPHCPSWSLSLAKKQNLQCCILLLDHWSICWSSPRWHGWSNYPCLLVFRSKHSALCKIGRYYIQWAYIQT